jgi:hypothetical protein
MSNNFVVQQDYWSYCKTVCMKKANILLEASTYCNISISWAQNTWHYILKWYKFQKKLAPLKAVLNYMFRCCNRSWSLWRHSVSWTARSLTIIYKYLRSGKRKTSLYVPSRNVGSTGAWIMFIILLWLTSITRPNELPANQKTLLKNHETFNIKRWTISAQMKSSNGLRAHESSCKKCKNLRVFNFLTHFRGFQITLTKAQLKSVKPWCLILWSC